MIDAIEKAIMDTVDKIDDVAKAELPKVTSKLVKKVFDGNGNNGRNWKPNTPSTVKRKKSSNPNIETGLLELTLSQPGFILDDAYMNKLPIPPRSNSIDGYSYANSTREFDNLGRTQQDEEYLEQQLEVAIANEFK